MKYWYVGVSPDEPDGNRIIHIDEMDQSLEKCLNPGYNWQRFKTREKALEAVEEIQNDLHKL